MPTQFKWACGLWLWAGTLGLLLILVILPLSWMVRALASLGVLIVVVLGWLAAGRNASQHRQSLALANGCSLPAAGFHQPVVAVCGDGLRALFGEAPENQLALRVTEQGCYLRVPSLERLPAVIGYVLANRPHWARQLSACYIVNPGEQSDNAVLAGSVQAFRHQVARVRRNGVALPVLLGCYLSAAHSESGWFTWEAPHAELAVRNGTSHLSATQWQQQPADLPTRASRLRACVQIESLGSWLAKTALPHLVSREQRDPPCPAIACAMALVPGAGASLPGNLWASWLHERTALEPAAQASGPASLPFPDPLLALLPRQTGLTPARRGALHALWLFVLAATVALCSSAWQNRLLVRQVSDDLRRYQAIPEPTKLEQPEHRLKEQAVAVLRSDAARLDRYYREGEPLSLGLGLYTAERIRPPLLAAIAAYRPPAPTPAQARIPDPVRLDSLSLFSSGSAELKPGSAKVLINALVDIKAQPGWLIVISGHSDTSGNPQRNLELSRARAEAVKDWMQRMGDIPDGCFIVQGQGAGQPIASNDTESGRRANRRVDIQLVPSAGACTARGH